MMTAQERKAVVDALWRSEARLLELVDGLTEEQRVFREAPERWSIEETVEHLVLQEQFVRGTVQRALDNEGAGEAKRAEVRAKGPLVAALAERRPEQRLKTRAANSPTGRRADFGAFGCGTAVRARADDCVCGGDTRRSARLLLCTYRVRRSGLLSMVDAAGDAHGSACVADRAGEGG